MSATRVFVLNEEPSGSGKGPSIQAGQLYNGYNSRRGKTERNADPARRDFHRERNIRRSSMLREGRDSRRFMMPGTATFQCGNNSSRNTDTSSLRSTTAARLGVVTSLKNLFTTSSLARKYQTKQMACNSLRSLPYVDPARIGIWGRGFGGMLTVNAMLHPRLFALKAGFTVAPIVDWFHYDTAFTERYLGSSVSNQDGYLSSSPLDSAHSLRNPLLVAQGTADLASTSRSGDGTTTRTRRSTKARGNWALSGAGAHYRWAGRLCSLISAGDRFLRQEPLTPARRGFPGRHQRIDRR